METLQSVFPAVPVHALQRVLDICDGSVETASEWILENNWRELLEEEEEEVDVDGDAGGDEGEEVDRDIEQQALRGNAVPAAAADAPASAVTATHGLTISGGSAQPGPGNAQFPPINNTNAATHHHAHQQQRHNHHHSHQFASTAVAGSMSATTTALSNGRALDRDFDSGGEHDLESDEGEFEEDEDEDDDDDDDDDDEDGHSYYDSGDEAYFHGGGGGSALPPLTKRIKITKGEDEKGSTAADGSNGAKMKDSKQEMYWVAFDGQVVRKTLIELLNTTLSKLAHSKVTLLNKSTKHIDELEANEKLVSVLTTIEDAASASAPEPEVIISRRPRAAATNASSSRNGIGHMLNDADAKPAAAALPLQETKASASAAAAAGQKRKRTGDEATAATQGFFAHFFSVSDLDMIWRSVMHAHLFNSRFGEMIEFHTASCGSFNKRDFDELMHIHSNMGSSRAASLGLSPVSTLKCCLILPCEASEEEIFRVGKHLHSLLKLQGSLYYRTLDDPIATPPSSVTDAANSRSSSERPVRSARSDLLNEDGKMTEDSFRRFARYRIKKEEPEAVETKEAHTLGPDHFLAYQQQRKVEYCLQMLTSNGWERFTPIFHHDNSTALAKFVSVCFQLSTKLKFHSHMSSGGQRRKGAGCAGVACEHTLGEQPLHLYGYLWVKPPALARGNDSHTHSDEHEHDDGDGDECKFSAIVTDTVVFKHQKPVKWLFTSKQEKGKILCKSRKSLSIGQVLQEFLIPKLYSRGSRNSENELILATFAYTERSTTTGELQLIVEHLDKAGLTAVVLHRDKPALSVLQRFVPTKSGYNHMIQSVFTPESCTIRKCVNANLIADTKLSVMQRTITFEADEDDLRARDVSNKELQQSIERIHLEFSAHLEKIVGKEIVRNVAYFKTGADDRVYLLWGSMLSFERPGKTFAKNHRLALSSTERHRQSASMQEINHSNKLVGLYSQLKCCPVCNQLLPRSQVEFLVTYKSIISYSENEVGFVRERGGQVSVPTMILKICGPMKKKRFEQLKQDTTFLYQTIQLCQPCSQELTPRQKEIPAATMNDEERVAKVPVAPKPLEKPSAHSMFWGRVARREAKDKSGVAAPKARPFSADIPRVRFQRCTSKSSHSSRQFHRQLSQLPPVAAQISAPSAQPEGVSQDMVEGIVQHLQRKYHRPSIRFALAQCNIFPSSSVIPVSVLTQICTPELATAIVKYWSVLSMSRGDTSESTTIDIDSFDGILMNRVKTDQDARRAFQVSESDALHNSTTTTSADNLIAHAPSRPTRPKSSSASMSSSQTNSFSARLMGEASGGPRRVVTAQASIEEGRAVCKVSELANGLASSSRLTDAIENLTVQAAGTHLRESTEVPSSEVRKKLCVDVVSSYELPSHVPIGVPATQPSKQQESTVLIRSVTPTDSKKPKIQAEEGSNELSEEELRVLEETLLKCG